MTTDTQLRELADSLVAMAPEAPPMPDLEPARHPTPRHRPVVVVAAAALLVVVVIGSLSVLLGGSDGGAPPATFVPPGTSTSSTTIADLTSEQAAVFDLAVDDLCEWFTAGDIDSMIADAQRKAGTDFVLDPIDPEGCWADDTPMGWTVDGPTEGSGFSAWGTATWPQGQRIERSMMVGIQRLLPQGSEWATTAYWLETHPGYWSHHPLLDDSVGYHVVRYTVAYEAGLHVHLWVEGSDDRYAVFLFGVGDGGAESTPKYEELGLAIFNELLERMNWIAPDG